MATVVLSYAGAAAGTLLGGPVGGMIGRALGAIAGNVIDQRLFSASGRNKQGPRLDNLRVMASEENTPIPLLWGRMRISGQVIWATNLIEDSTTTTANANGKSMSGPTTTDYAYFANFAVGLCEGEIDSIGRVWADGREIDLSAFTTRLYRGTETQSTDSLIEAIEGTDAAPAYRGLAYIVFDRLPLVDFGNRIPQLSFEVFRAGNKTAAKVKAMCVIPGSTEFGYDTTPVQREISKGKTTSENVHAAAEATDWSVSIEQLTNACRNLEMASLIVSWFGTDLRCNHCEVKPGVDDAGKTTSGATWQVNGISRSTAYEVSRVNGAPAYGGTPSDGSVIRAIADLKNRGVKVMFYPFVLMDVPADNGLPDPYGGTEQGTYPWRGRITTSIAPGRAGTPDKTASAATQINQFVGTAAPSDFSAGMDTTVYSGPAEWSYRRMVLHYAKLCAVAGGVDAFLIGSELRGLTTLRSSADVFPFVSALQTLAAEVKAILPDAKISYAADWSEYFGYHPGDGSGDVYYHLDPLWAASAIDFIGIDNYMPLSDWRDGGNHLDRNAGHASIYDLNYLKGNIAGGEGYDWYYASEADRENQVRTPISDGAYGKPWVYRFKDLKNWWSNSHHNRPNGIEAASATAWQPQSKPFWFTELGCAAMDKATNSPNLFFDAKSSESNAPPFSSGLADEVIQHRYVRASQDYWSATGAHNPSSNSYAGRMVEHTRLFYWAWDARPFPVFPALTSVWSDGENFATGHWLNGRIGAVDLGELIVELCQRFGVSAVNVDGVAGLVHGFLVDRPMSARDALEDILVAHGIDAVESAGVLVFRTRAQWPIGSVLFDDLVDGKIDDPIFDQTRAQETDLPQAVRIGYVETANDYRTASVSQRRTGGGSLREIALTLPAAVSQSHAQARADVMLEEAWAQRTSAKFSLPPSALRFEPGDVLTINNKMWRLGTISDGAALHVQALSHAPEAYEPTPVPSRNFAVATVPTYGAPDVIGFDLAFASGEQPARPWFAAQASPWPRKLTVVQASSDTTFVFNGVITSRATLGITLNAFGEGVLDRVDYTRTLDVLLSYGALSAVSTTALLNGANLAAIGDDSGGYELIQFQSAELIAANTYRLTGLLRGLAGTAAEMMTLRSAGQNFVLLNAAVMRPSLTGEQAARPSTWRIGPSSFDHGHASYVEQSFDNCTLALRPLAPVSFTARGVAAGVQFSWIRQARSAADSWDVTEIPVGETSEAYEVHILDGATVVRRITVIAPQALYTTAEMLSDFGISPATLTARVAQISQSYGLGTTTERTFDV